MGISDVVTNEVLKAHYCLENVDRVAGDHETTAFKRRARLQQALTRGRPELFNMDQGTQFTAQALTAILDAAGIAISMDGRARAHDDIFIERFWRTVRYEDIYLKEYTTVPALSAGLGDYFISYNHARMHQSLGYRQVKSH